MQATLGGPSSSAAAVPKRRDPTPDHPPYACIIQEAILALAEDGGSVESAISGFIRGRYPGVPAAHDRFLRYYLAKHVAEGLFVCAAPGRYSCCSDDEPKPVLALTDIPAPAAPARAATAAGAGPPMTGPKRPPGRPRKSKEPAAAAGAGPPTTGPKRPPGRPRKYGSLPLLAKEAAAFSTPECSTQGCKMPLVAADENSAAGDLTPTEALVKSRRKPCKQYLPLKK